jgi:hypothetical protein
MSTVCLTSSYYENKRSNTLKLKRLFQDAEVKQY